MKLIAFTTVTIKDETTGQDINISIETEDSSILPGGSTIAKVFTDPSSYLSSVGVDATEGSFSGGSIETDTVTNEDIALTKTSEDGFATGNLSHAPIGTPSYTVLASIGGSSGVVFSGSQVQATDENTYALVVRCSYSYQYKKYKYTAPSSPAASIAILMGFLNA